MHHLTPCFVQYISFSSCSRLSMFDQVLLFWFLVYLFLQCFYFYIFLLYFLFVFWSDIDNFISNHIFWVLVHQIIFSIDSNKSLAKWCICQLKLIWGAMLWLNYTFSFHYRHFEGHRKKQQKVLLCLENLVWKIFYVCVIQIWKSMLSYKRNSLVDFNLSFSFLTLI